jgi:uncharacterized protein YdeI (YjbR/CyaY-like superfamily)
MSNFANIKTEATRQRRMEKILTMLESGQKLH